MTAPNRIGWDDLLDSGDDLSRRLVTTITASHRHMSSCGKRNVNTCKTCRRVHEGTQDAFRQARAAGMALDTRSLRAIADATGPLPG